MARVGEQSVITGSGIISGAYYYSSKGKQYMIFRGSRGTYQNARQLGKLHGKEMIALLILKIKEGAQEALLFTSQDVGSPLQPGVKPMVGYGTSMRASSGFLGDSGTLPYKTGAMQTSTGIGVHVIGDLGQTLYIMQRASQMQKVGPLIIDQKVELAKPIIMQQFLEGAREIAINVVKAKVYDAPVHVKGAEYATTTPVGEISWHSSYFSKAKEEKGLVQAVSEGIKKVSGFSNVIIIGIDEEAAPYWMAIEKGHRVVLLKGSGRGHSEKATAYDTGRWIEPRPFWNDIKAGVASYARELFTEIKTSNLVRQVGAIVMHQILNVRGTVVSDEEIFAGVGIEDVGKKFSPGIGLETYPGGFGEMDSSVPINPIHYEGRI